MQLAALLREHTGAVEADLQRYYSLDLAGYWRGELSLRRLSVLVQHLPTDSATARALGSPGWSIGDYLVSDVYHALTGNPHPSRPDSGASSKSSRYAALRARLEAHRARTSAQPESV